MNIGIRSNLVNRIKKIREGKVYGSKVGFVAELIQNAQRAKAKNIWIDVGESTFTIEDDGKGCKNPEDVFTLDCSGWGEDVVSPFGEGFASVFAVADQITVLSKDWIAELDLRNCLETGNLEQVQINQVADRLDGFRVRLTYSGVSQYNITEEAEKIAGMIKPNCYINGDLVSKTTITYEPFTFRKKTRFGEILAAPTAHYDHGIDLYYEGRPVKKYSISGIKGIMALTPNAVTLRVPDRRDIVEDDKYYLFCLKMKELQREVLLHLIKHYPELVGEYRYEIGYSLQPSEYYKYLSYGLLPDEQQREVDRTAYVAADLGAEPLSYQRNVRFSRNTRKQPNNDNNEIKEIRRLLKKGRLFYVEADESKYDDDVANLEYYGLTVLKVDYLRAKVMEYLKVPHVSEASKNVVRHYCFSNVGCKNKKEERVIQLLNKIMLGMNLPSNLFHLADITEIVRVEILGKVLSKEKVVTNAVFEKDVNGYKILLNRKMLKGYPLNVNSKLGTAKDLKLLGRISVTVAHELAHMLKDTVDNTLEHYKAQDQLYMKIQEIINKVF